MEAVFHFAFVLVDKNALTLGFVVVLVEKMHLLWILYICWVLWVNIHIF